jgi:hypothetical protein
MPSQLKDHGEVKFKGDQAGVEDTVIGEFEGVRIYHRKRPHGPPTLNGTHKDRGPIERIAERLHADGYAVKLEKFELGPVTHHDFVAVWSGQGEPPPPPFT